ncbi:MAG TPA: DICT sensory domain-containing protein [Conexibacter sp.]
MIPIGEVAVRTGVGEATLRMWEQRYGFPEPERANSGARRYSERDVDLIRQVVRDRDRGLALRAAIARARLPSGAEESLFASLRRALPELSPQRLPKRALVAMSRAIEDEALACAQRAVVLAAFQRERFYRQSQRRWAELARTARLAAVLADFAAPASPPRAPLELPLEPDAPLRREWAVVVDAPGCAACLAAWEVPGGAGPHIERVYEAVWTVAPEPVRAAARILLGNGRARAAELLADADQRLDELPLADEEGLERVVALTNRMVAYVARATVAPAPSPAM